MENFFYQTRCILHRMPELALEEYKTAKYIREFLEERNIPYETIGTSTVALFEGKEDSWLGFRADIDALPLQEEGEKSYKSEIPGKMHACGHDGHTTNLLYFAKWLKEEINRGVELKKSVMLIFQAGEEGKGGARFIADSEVFKSKKFEGIFALHVSPELKEGIIASNNGPMSFQNINLDIEIVGKGCHGAQPYKGIDSILVGAKLVEAYQSVVSRNIEPYVPVVLTIGSFKAGEVRNIIPEKVSILGTIRLINVELIDFLRERLTSINEGLERAFGVKINMVFKPFYPPVINSEELYEKLKNVVEKERFVEKSRLTGSEDFSFYLQNGNKGLYFILGVRNEEKGYVHSVHNPKFDFDPNVLKEGFEIFRKLLIEMKGIE